MKYKLFTPNTQRVFVCLRARNVPEMIKDINVKKEQFFVAVTGPGIQLGLDSTDRAPRMRYNMKENLWEREFWIEAKTKLEYNYIIINRTTNKVIYKENIIKRQVNVENKNITMEDNFNRINRRRVDKQRASAAKMPNKTTEEINPIAFCNNMNAATLVPRGVRYGTPSPTCVNSRLETTIKAVNNQLKVDEQRACAAKMPIKTTEEFNPPCNNLNAATLVPRGVRYGTNKTTEEIDPLAVGTPLPTYVNSRQEATIKAVHKQLKVDKQRASAAKMPNKTTEKINPIAVCNNMNDATLVPRGIRYSKVPPTFVNSRQEATIKAVNRQLKVQDDRQFESREERIISQENYEKSFEKQKECLEVDDNDDKYLKYTHLAGKVGLVALAAYGIYTWCSRKLNT